MLRALVFNLHTEGPDAGLWRNSGLKTMPIMAMGPQSLRIMYLDPLGHTMHPNSKTTIRHLPRKEPYIGESGMSCFSDCFCEFCIANSNMA